MRAPVTHTLSALSVVIMTMIAGCNNTSSDAAPKPSAYHRIEIPDSVFSTIEINGVEMLFNTKAKVEMTPNHGDEWLNISYSLFPCSKLHLTLTSTDPEEFNSILGNRKERIRLDVGNLTTEATELTSTGKWNCSLFVTRSSITTPIHILASNHGKTKILSGTLHIDTTGNPSATPDSIAPIVTTCARDLLTLLKSITDK